MNKKRVLITNIILVYIIGFFNIAYASDDIFQGHIEKQDKIKKEQSELFTGSVDKLNYNNVLKMTVSRVLDTNSAKENDEFFAQVMDDVEGKDGIIIPKGTVAHGCIKKVTGAKRLGRNGSLDLSFDYLITPDGKEIPIKGKMSTRLHLLVAASGLTADNLVYATAGGITGGLLALSFCGLAGTASSQGTVIAGGAALGSTIGLGIALYRKGQDILISPGDEIQVRVYSSSKLPVYKKNAFPQDELKKEGLNVKINDVIYKKDLFGDVDKIILSLSILNMSDKIFSLFDIALVNEAGTVYYPDTFDGENMFNELKKGDNFSGQIPFCVDNVKNRFWLTFYDKSSREVVSKVSIDNACKEIPVKSIKQNKKILKKKNNFYKDELPDFLMRQ
ncbi:MAG: hypothetical protein PHC64_00030 [Candidatus Gastranaerophilales bacterium]|nr:hypothetical protein [Candidatus Gastranaerophilales bacterium]